MSIARSVSFSALAAMALTAAAGRAEAYMVYVTNEKDNSVTVIDSEKQEVVKTFKVGQRPRGIIMSKDGKWLIICTSDDNIIQSTMPRHSNS